MNTLDGPVLPRFPASEAGGPTDRKLAWTGVLLALLGTLWMLVTPLEAQASRIKEIAAVQGVRSNPLTGYGIVVGLDGTGDQTTQTPFTTQSLNAMLQQFGITVPAGTVTPICCSMA